MSLSEKAIQLLEEQIPELAEKALKQAYWNALASGSVILTAEDGNLKEIHPDGTRTVLKKLPKSTKVTVGQKLELPRDRECRISKSYESDYT